MSKKGNINTKNNSESRIDPYCAPHIAFTYSFFSLFCKQYNVFYSVSNSEEIVERCILFYSRITFWSTVSVAFFKSRKAPKM